MKIVPMPYSHASTQTMKSGQVCFIKPNRLDAATPKHLMRKLTIIHLHEWVYYYLIE